MRQNRLLQLLADNRHAFTPIEQRIVRADVQEGEADSATIYLYDPIVGDRMSAEWWGGICPQDLVPALASLSVSQIDLRINCPGGDVFATEAICQALRESGANVTAHIEGIAASAATLIACACDEVLITPASQYMIHEAWTLAYGNKTDLAALLDQLAMCDASIAAAYQTRTGQDLAQCNTWMEAETWFTAAQAVEFGFADAIKEPTAKASAQTSAQAPTWKLSAYAPRQSAKPAQHAKPDHRARQEQRLRALKLTEFV